MVTVGRANRPISSPLSWCQCWQIRWKPRSPYLRGQRRFAVGLRWRRCATACGGKISWMFRSSSSGTMPVIRSLISILISIKPMRSCRTIRCAKRLWWLKTSWPPRLSMPIFYCLIWWPPSKKILCQTIMRATWGIWFLASQQLALNSSAKAFMKWCLR